MNLSLIRWQQALLLACCCSLVTLFSCTPLEAGSSDSPVGDLHVFVFEDTSEPSPEVTEPEVFQTDEVDLPVRVSEALLGSLTGFAGRISGLPEKMGYLDMHTFDIEGKIEKGVKWAERENRFTRLDYKVRIVEWREEGFVLELKIRFQREKWHLERIVSEDPLRTTIVRLNGRRPLGVAFSRLGKTVDGCPVWDFDEGSDFHGHAPTIVKQTMPSFPPDLLGVGLGDTVSVLVCIDTNGRVRPHGFILLECSQPRFAEEAMGKVLKDWRFEPARQNDKAMAVAATIEVQFALLADLP